METNSSKVLIAGGTGAIGKQLEQKLNILGFTTSILTRNPKSKNHIFWNPSTNEIDNSTLLDHSIIINLSGENLSNRRWTTSVKERLLKSRVDGNNLLKKQIIDLNWKPSLFISASAIGFYGDQSADKVLNENNEPGEGFMAMICKQWEHSANEIQKIGIPTAILRIGIVLFNGGALKEMLPSYTFRIGTYFGDGKQVFSWIHMDDLIDMVALILKNKLTGVYNAVAPNPVDNKKFAYTIGDVKKGKHIILPVPKALLKIALGEMSQIVLNGNRVSSKKIQDAGFQFQYPVLNEAIKAIINKS